MSKQVKLLSIVGLLIASLALFAYRFQPQKTAYTGSLGDASTDCDGSTDPTADLTCLNTGDITVGGWAQMSVQWVYARGAGAAGTYVNIQCDAKNLSNDQWYLDSTCSAAECSKMTWKWAVTASTAHKVDFGLVSEVARCRCWVTSGNANDQVKLSVRVASTVGSK